MTNTYGKDNSRLTAKFKDVLTARNWVLGYATRTLDKETVYAVDVEGNIKAATVDLPNDRFKVGGMAPVNVVPDDAEYLGIYAAN